MTCAPAKKFWYGTVRHCAAISALKYDNKLAAYNYTSSLAL